MKLFFNHRLSRTTLTNVRVGRARTPAAPFGRGTRPACPPHGRAALVAAIITIAISSLADDPTISVSARQRYPWNGLVDVHFTITGDAGTKYDTSFTAKDMVGNTNIAMRTIRKADGTAAAAKESLLPGTYSWVWDTVADLKVDRVTHNGFLTTSSTTLFVNRSLNAVRDFSIVFGGASITIGEMTNGKAYNIKTDGNGKSIQFQVINGGYLKCVCVHLEQSGNDIVGYIKWARYMAETFPLGTDFDTASYTQYTIATSNTGSGYGVSSMTITCPNSNPRPRFDRVRVIGTVEEGPGKVQLWAGGPYWATMNIGATKPEEYGYYFWWGDTIGYKRQNNKWVASDGSSSNYSFTSAPTYYLDPTSLKNQGWTTGNSVGALVAKHDAASAHWQNGWRMPTDQEVQDLANKCAWTWTTLNSVKGYVVRGKGNYASVSIFLPAAGYGYETSLKNGGTAGCYWSSVPCPVSAVQYTWYLGLSSSGYGKSGYMVRSAGTTIRPVCNP